MLKFLLLSALKNKGNRNFAYTNNSSDYKSFPSFFSFDFEYFSIILWHFEVKLAIVWIVKWILLRDFLCWMCVSYKRRETGSNVRAFVCGYYHAAAWKEEQRKRSHGYLAPSLFFYSFVCLYTAPLSSTHTHTRKPGGYRSIEPSSYTGSYGSYSLWKRYTTTLSILRSVLLLSLHQSFRRPTEKPQKQKERQRSGNIIITVCIYDA